MPSSTTRTVGPAVNTIDASALESLEAINQRLKDGGITFHLSEVKGPVMDRLKRSHFLAERTGKVHPTQYDAVASIKAREVSMPSWELFEQQDQVYRDTVLPPQVTARAAVEEPQPLAGRTMFGFTVPSWA